MTEQILSNAAIFNGIVGVLLRNLRVRPLGYHLLHPETRDGLVRQLVAAVVEGLKSRNERPKDFMEVIGHLGSITIELDHRKLTGLD